MCSFTHTEYRDLVHEDVPTEDPEHLLEEARTMQLVLDTRPIVYRQLTALEESTTTQNFTLKYEKDIPYLNDPSLFSFIPVYQEGYALSTIQSGKGIATWGTVMCVVLSIYNPFDGMYLTHMLENNDFFPDVVSTARTNGKGGQNTARVCTGRPSVQDTLPDWLNDKDTVVYMYSGDPETLKNRITQLRYVYSGPITAYIGMVTYDGSRFNGKKNKYNTRVHGSDYTFAITPMGDFCIAYKRYGDMPAYLKLYGREAAASIGRALRSVSRRADRKCIYQTPPPSLQATPPRSPLLQSELAAMPNNKRREMERLFIGGTRKRKQTRRRKNRRNKRNSRK